MNHFEKINLILARNYGSVGDFRVAQRIAALDPLGHNIRVNYALEYTAALLKKDNVILIGSRRSNPWVDLFATNLNFTIEYDPNAMSPKCGTVHYGRVNRRPIRTTASGLVQRLQCRIVSSKLR